MKYDIELFDYRTNARRHVDYEHEGWPEIDVPPDDAVQFNWGENNFSDDCNRQLYLYDWGRAEGTPIPPDVDGCTEFIKVRIVNVETGKVVLDELASEHPDQN